MTAKQNEPIVKGTFHRIFEEPSDKKCLNCGDPIINRAPHSKYCINCCIYKTCGQDEKRKFGKRNRVSEVKEKILKFLSVNKDGCTLSQIIYGIKEHPSNVKKSLTRLELDGKIFKFGTYYILEKVINRNI